jgi:benzoyl-CoA reductase/2-hydroxyglutaryl-CoA dehydratase subunit BcrC/BadD/HgdB
LEGTIIGRIVKERLKVPVVEIEVPPLSDSIEPTLQTRLEALVETVRSKKRP